MNRCWKQNYFRPENITWEERWAIWYELIDVEKRIKKRESDRDELNGIECEHEVIMIASKWRNKHRTYVLELKKKLKECIQTDVYNFTNLHCPLTTAPKWGHSETSRKETKRKLWGISRPARIHLHLKNKNKFDYFKHNYKSRLPFNFVYKQCSECQLYGRLESSQDKLTLNYIIMSLYYCVIKSKKRKESYLKSACTHLLGLKAV